MGRAITVICWILLALGSVSAQTARVEKGLPQWLTGILAVVVFLFLVFITFLVKKAWFDSPRQECTMETMKTNDFIMTNGTTYETTADMVRSKDHQNAYENVVVNSLDDKVTAM